MQTLTTSRQPLTDLIVEVMDRTGATYSSLAAKARRAGHPISRAQINNYVLGAAAMPGQRMVEGLAAALDVPAERILDLAIEQFYTVDHARVGDTTTDMVIPSDLTEEELEVIRAFIAARRRPKGEA